MWGRVNDVTYELLLPVKMHPTRPEFTRSVNYELRCNDGLETTFGQDHSCTVRECPLKTKFLVRQTFLGEKIAPSSRSSLQVLSVKDMTLHRRRVDCLHRWNTSEE